MATEIFTKSEFENALPKHKKTGEPLWESLGLVQGEQAYQLKIDNSTAIHVRSSVDNTGFCASTGKDSIRAWLVTSDNKPLGSKVTKWTTRIKGWETRTQDVLRSLWSRRLKAGNCPKCDNPKSIFKVKKEGPNKGKIFAKCDTCEGTFSWI